jgi:hypothetical protein
MYTKYYTEPSRPLVTTLKDATATSPTNGSKVESVQPVVGGGGEAAHASTNGDAASLPSPPTAPPPPGHVKPIASPDAKTNPPEGCPYHRPDETSK